MTMTANPRPTEAERFTPAGDYFYFEHRPDPSKPAESSEEIELEEYASPT